MRHRQPDDQLRVPGADAGDQLPRAPDVVRHQASIGVQRQIATQASVEVNYSYTGGRREEPTTTVNANLTYNPATGANYPFTNVAARPFPTWGTVNFELLDGWSNYHGTDFTFTKRFSNRWQANATYTLAFFKDANPRRDQWSLGSDGIVAQRPLGFALAQDLGGEYGYAAGTSVTART